jgi:hypothetical protein
MTSPQNTIFVETESVTESDSATEPESNPDNEFSEYYGNQLGLPQYQYSIITSSPPPVDVDHDVNLDNFNNEGEFFFFEERFAITEFSVSQSSLWSSSQCR